MLSIELMTEAAKRFGDGPGWGAVVCDACDQGKHGMDAPDTVKDGAEWLSDEFEPDVSGPVPRLVNLRDQEGGA